MRHPNSTAEPLTKLGNVAYLQAGRWHDKYTATSHFLGYVKEFEEIGEKPLPERGKYRGVAVCNLTGECCENCLKIACPDLCFVALQVL